ncbi:hypothetical protein AABB24_034092, partial [Solanum stoloniferum]
FFFLFSPLPLQCSLSPLFSSPFSDRQTPPAAPTSEHQSSSSQPAASEKPQRAAAPADENPATSVGEISISSQRRHRPSPSSHVSPLFSPLFSFLIFRRATSAEQQQQPPDSSNRQKAAATGDNSEQQRLWTTTSRSNQANQVQALGR